MVGSSDFLDFCMEEVPGMERKVIPIDCWQKVSLRDIWIPSHLLPNRSQSKNTQAAQGIFHTLEKKDPSKYIKSFSVYLDSKTEEEEIFFSDSDEDIFDLPKFEETTTLPDNALPTASSMLPPFRNISSNDDSIKNGNVNSNFKRKNDDMYPRDNLTFVNLTNSSLDTGTNLNEEKSLKVLNSAGNLMNNERCKESIRNQKISNNDVTKSLSSLAIVNDFHTVKTKNFEGGDRQPLEREGQDTDSLISLNEILNATPDINMNDFTFNFKEKSDFTFNFKEKNDSAIFSTHDGPNSKKQKKEKKNKKKASKQITLDMLFEDPETTQEFYCDKYLKKILQEKDRNTQINEEKCEEYSYFEPEENLGFYETTDENAACSTKYFNKPENINRTSINENDEISTRSTNQSEEKTKSAAAEKKSSSSRLEKLVIENIPHGASKEDISSILVGLGEIKRFSLIPTGMFLTAFVEIDLIDCDIDWVIECIDGSEPFGASCDVLRCYKQED